MITGSFLINDIAEYTRPIFDQQALLSLCFSSRRATFDFGCQAAGGSQKDFRNISLAVVISYQCTYVDIIHAVNITFSYAEDVRCEILHSYIFSLILVHLSYGKI